MQPAISFVTIAESQCKLPWVPLKSGAARLAFRLMNDHASNWAVRENVRAQQRVIVKRILRKYGYPPDKQEKATQTVLEQAEWLSELRAVA